MQKENALERKVQQVLCIKINAMVLCGVGKLEINNFYRVNILLWDVFVSRLV